MYVSGVENPVVKIRASHDCRHALLGMMAAVASADFVFVADLVVELEVELPSRMGVERHRAKVWIRKHGSRDIGVRIQVDQLLPDRIDLVGGNLVEDAAIRELIARAQGS